MPIAAGRNRPCPLLEMLEKRRRYEAGAGRIEMLVASRSALEALRNRQHQLILGARHGDVEQSPFLLDVLRAARPQIGGDAAVDGVDIGAV
jgi:hypothetical protein